VLANVRKTLDGLQNLDVAHPAVDQVMELIAGCLAKVVGLNRLGAQAQPAAQPAAAPAAAAPEPAPQPAPAAQPAPAPAPQPAPAAQPAPAPAPQPAPAAQPAPAPAPQPAPAPAPDPAPHVAAQPAARVPAKTERLDPEAPIPLVHPLPARAPAAPDLGAQAVQVAPVQTVAEAPAPQHYPPAPPPPAERPAAAPAAPSAPQPTVPMFAGAAAQLPTTQVASVDPHGQTSFDHAQAARAAQVAQAPQPAPAAPSAAPAPGGDVREVELGAMSESNFYKGLSGPDVIEHGGIFVATYKIPPVGSQVTLRVHLPSKGQPLEFTARAIVRWTRESRDGSGAPGFGARFVPNGLSSEGRNLVYRYARNREPMFYDDDL
jgi:hypothetical protein